MTEKTLQILIRHKGNTMKETLHKRENAFRTRSSYVFSYLMLPWLHRIVPMRQKWIESIQERKTKRKNW